MKGSRWVADFLEPLAFKGSLTFLLFFVCSQGFCKTSNQLVIFILPTHLLICNVSRLKMNYLQVVAITTRDHLGWELNKCLGHKQWCSDS